MNAKMKSCFSRHTMMHSLFGLGLGFIISTLLPRLPLLWIGLALLLISTITDAMRKELK